MTLFLSCLALFALCFLYLLRHRQTRTKNLPPGPLGLPLLGNVLQINKHPGCKMAEWAKIYGPIFRIKMGMQNAVIINDHKLLKELFNDPVTAGRDASNVAWREWSRGRHGIVNSEGDTWQQQRLFTIKTLKRFGFGKSACMESTILEEARTVVEWLKENSQNPVQIAELFGAPVLNSLWRIVSWERCPWEKGHCEILESFKEFSDTGAEVVNNRIYFAPFLRRIFPEKLGWNRYLRASAKFRSILENIIQRHEATFDANNPRDFIDYQLLENQKGEEAGGSSFCGEAGQKNMRSTILDLFGAGSDTTANTLSYSLLYFAHYPQVQKKIQEEIDRVLSTAFPNLNARAQMPYTEAAIQELLRVTSIVPIGIPHEMMEDKWFHGYLLPKGLTVFGNLYGIHFDTEIWGDPENFRPERFLDKEGKKVEKFHPALVSFSEGKRACIGQSLAKDTLFLFITSILQEFDIKPANTQTKPDFDPICIVVSKPKPSHVVFAQRN